MLDAVNGLANCADTRFAPHYLKGINAMLRCMDIDVEMIRKMQDRNWDVENSMEPAPF